MAVDIIWIPPPEMLPRTVVDVGSPPEADTLILMLFALGTCLKTHSAMSALFGDVSIFF